MFSVKDKLVAFWTKVDGYTAAEENKREDIAILKNGQHLEVLVVQGRVLCHLLLLDN